MRFTGLLHRELLLHYRRRSELLNPLLFFVSVTLLFPLAVSANPKLLTVIGVGVVLVAALLAQLLTLPSLFQSDYWDGSLELFVLDKELLLRRVIAKLLGQLCVILGPLLVMTPLIGLMYDLDLHSIVLLQVVLAMLLPILYFLGAMVAALTVSLRQQGLLLALLVMPLYIPALIFSASIPMLATQHINYSGPLLMLLSLLVLALTISPVVTAFALRLSIGYDG